MILVAHDVAQAQKRPPGWFPRAIERPPIARASCVINLGADRPGQESTADDRLQIHNSDPNRLLNPFRKSKYQACLFTKTEHVFMDGST